MTQAELLQWGTLAASMIVPITVALIMTHRVTTVVADVKTEVKATAKAVDDKLVVMDGKVDVAVKQTDGVLGKVEALAMAAGAAKEKEKAVAEDALVAGAHAEGVAEERDRSATIVEVATEAAGVAVRAATVAVAANGLPHAKP